ncbi:hypothetical protein WKI58_04075 [Streptomyces halotolerans]|uniref:Uncharacterized protein n=2 Tax=Streptomyces pratisoli TaxID=3139917 RepID=A0ACC6QD20_9ACTN
MVGPDAERTATVRHFARLFVVGSHLRAPLVSLVLRKTYGLGAIGLEGAVTTGPGDDRGSARISPGNSTAPDAPDCPCWCPPTSARTTPD